MNLGMQLQQEVRKTTRVPLKTTELSAEKTENAFDSRALWRLVGTSKEVEQEIADAAKALNHAKRIAILSFVGRGPKSFSDIAEEVISDKEKKNRVVYHLYELVSRGFVEKKYRKRTGPRAEYRLTPHGYRIMNALALAIAPRTVRRRFFETCILGGDMADHASESVFAFPLDSEPGDAPPFTWQVEESGVSR